MQHILLWKFLMEKYILYSIEEKEGGIEVHILVSHEKVMKELSRGDIGVKIGRCRIIFSGSRKKRKRGNVIVAIEGEKSFIDRNKANKRVIHASFLKVEEMLSKRKKEV